MTSWADRIRLDRSDCAGSLFSVLFGARYKWEAGYSIRADDEHCVVEAVPSEIPGVPPSVRKRCFLSVVVRIRLDFDDDVTNQAALRQRWRDGIRNAWSLRFKLTKVGGDAPCDDYYVAFDVEFVNSGEDHVVKVEHGSGGANSDRWYDGSSAGSAAHEFGHLLGMKDEYPDESCPRRSLPTGETPPSIMDDSQIGEVKRRHYQPFADWLSRKTGSTYRAR